ncbi:hypothetical protein [Marinagarivorans algicola]|uniref:hypothetical protein n=1 Tax=Marinagarivorans algicola TaxID=1513270 RepID=UPI0006B42AAA|nr:hypothetical protein [Marinagarivorans algicola]
MAIFNYQTLDTLADTYIPTLAIIALISMAAKLGQPRIAFKELCAFALLVFLAYGLMFMDATHRIWASQGWDYSTHTATAGACVWYLFWLHKGRRVLGGVFQQPWVYVFWPVSLVGYLALMRYQQYHSWLDMLTTLMAITPFFTLHYFATR